MYSKLRYVYSFSSKKKHKFSEAVPETLLVKVWNSKEKRVLGWNAKILKNKESYDLFL
jgi:hypothetical protein